MVDYSVSNFQISGMSSPKQVSKFGIMRKTEINRLARLTAACLIGLTSSTFVPPAYSQDAIPPYEDDASVDEIPDAADILTIDGNQEFEFEKNAQQLQQGIRQQAFNNALESLLPLRPEEIRVLLERFDRTQESVAVPVYPDPEPQTVVQTVTMDPGTKPLVVKTAFGHVTTIAFVDATGAPWPIRNITWAGEFDIVEYEAPSSTNADGEEERDPKGSHILKITPETEFARGNISINMLTLKTPIIMTLEANREIVHYRFDAVVPEYGPFAQTPLIDNGITLAAGRADVSGLLQGIIPNGAEKLNVYGVDGRTSAYQYNGQTYLRTPLNLLSPAWSSSVSAADGTKVYEIPNTPVVLLSDRGSMVRAKITDREVVLDE